MKRFHVNKWNKRLEEYTMLILTEVDIKNEVSYVGAGFDMVVMPLKFKKKKNPYLDSLRFIQKARKCEIIYV